MLSKMIIILTKAFMRPVLARSAGVSLALAIGAAVVPAHAAQPVVVAVDGTLCDLTKTLAAGAASVTCLIPPGGDPHSYRLKPSDRSQIAKSDLVLHIGFGLTPSAKKLKSPGTVVAVGEVALPSYGGSDPHVWHDPANSAAMVRVISRSYPPCWRPAIVRPCSNAQRGLWLFSRPFRAGKPSSSVLCPQRSGSW